MRTAQLLVLAAALLALSAPVGAQEPLVGAWEPTSYVLASGDRHSVDGRIFFTDTDWTVLFFVTEAGEPRRGSAEGGTYTTEGERLVFTHRFHLSVGEEMEGLPRSALRMELRPPGQGTLEASTFHIRGEELTLMFPSGNRMEFTRASKF